MTLAAERPLRRRTIALYAVGSLGTGGFATLPGLVLIYFLTDTLGVAAIAAGALVTVAKEHVPAQETQPEAAAS